MSESWADVEGRMGNSPIIFKLRNTAIRAHYYTTCGSGHGEDDRIEKKLVGLGFTPYVDAVSKDDRDTYDRIDVQLASHFIGNAYRDNYEIALLISGDGDYIPAVREVQRCGKVVFLAGFDHPQGGISSELKMTCDYFIDLCDCLLDLDES